MSCRPCRVERISTRHAEWRKADFKRRQHEWWDRVYRIMGPVVSARDDACRRVADANVAAILHREKRSKERYSDRPYYLGRVGEEGLIRFGNHGKAIGEEPTW